VHALKNIILRWNITNKCSMECNHCYNKNLRNSYDIDMCESDVIKIINNLPTDAIRYVKLSGGEPFESDLLPPICKNLSSSFIDYGISTNGMFDYNEFNYVFSSDRCKFVAISLDGFLEKHFNTFRNKASADIVFKNMRIIKEKHPGIKMAINLVLNRDNFSDIEEILSEIFFSLYIDKVNMHYLYIAKFANFK